MGLTHSTRRNRFKTYRFLARNLITPIGEIVLLKEAFCGLPGTKLSKLKNLHSEVFTKIHWERFMRYFSGKAFTPMNISIVSVSSQKRVCAPDRRFLTR